MSSRASYHTASLLYMSVLVPHCSAVMRPSRQHAVMSTSVRFCIRILEACPSQSQVLQDRDFAGRLGADQSRIRFCMGELSPRSTADLGAALKWLFERSNCSARVAAHAIPLKEYSSRFPVTLRKRASESESTFELRVARQDGEAASNEVWVDRFLFLLPMVDSFTPPNVFYETTRQRSGAGIDRTAPVDVWGGRCEILASQIQAETRPHRSPAEFTFYAKHFSRSDYDSRLPSEQLRNLRSVVTLIESCPTPFDLVAALRAPAGAKRFTHLSEQVKACMHRLAGVPTSKIQKSLTWLIRRRSRAYLVMQRGIPLSVFSSEYSLAPKRPSDYDDVSYAELIADAASRPLSVEVWLDRFLFQAPSREAVRQWRDPEAPYMLSDPIFVKYSESDPNLAGYVDRLFPVARSSNGLVITPSPFLAMARGHISATLTYCTPAGTEFRYYSGRYPRRKAR